MESKDENLGQIQYTFLLDSSLTRARIYRHTNTHTNIIKKQKFAHTHTFISVLGKTFLLNTDKLVTITETRYLKNNRKITLVNNMSLILAQQFLMNFM